MFLSFDDISFELIETKQHQTKERSKERFCFFRSMLFHSNRFSLSPAMYTETRIKFCLPAEFLQIV
jgi:hypothetical protein